MEPNTLDHPSSSNTDLVTIAITVTPASAQVKVCSSAVHLSIPPSSCCLLTLHFALQNIGGVMAAVAQLLRVPVPLHYQLSRPAGSDQASLALLAGARGPLPRVPSADQRQNYWLFSLCLVIYQFSVCRFLAKADSRDQLLLLGARVSLAPTHTQTHRFPSPDSCLCSVSFRCPTCPPCSQTSGLQLLQRHAGTRSPGQGADH